MSAPVEEVSNTSVETNESIDSPFPQDDIDLDGAKQDLPASANSENTNRRKRRISLISKSEDNRKDDDNNDDLLTTSPSTSSNSSGSRRTKDVLLSKPQPLQPSRTRKRPPRDCLEEENESACCECEGGGELICCDTCVRAFHLVCLPMRYRPVEQSDSTVSNEWSCPVCLYFRVHDDLEKRRGILLTLQHPLPVPSPECDPRVKRLKSRRALDNDDFSEYEQDEDDEQQPVHRRPKRFTHLDLFRQSHHHYLFEDIKKRRAIAGPADTETPSESGVGSRTRRQAAAAAGEKKTASSAESNAPSTCGSVGRMNVGPSFQIPQLPLSFLEVQDMDHFCVLVGRSYNRVDNFRFSRAMMDCRVVYSATEWKQYANRFGTRVPFDESPPSVVNAEEEKELIDIDVAVGKEVEGDMDMKSVELMLKEIDRVIESPDSINIPPEKKKAFVDSEEKLKEFCSLLSSRWSSRCNWPYCDEYAYKILHHAKFDSKAALDAIEDPTFDFLTVCDPPVRPYFNKWRPKDKRSMFPCKCC